VKKMDKVNGSDAKKTEKMNWSTSWIQINQHRIPITPDTLLSSRMDAQRSELSACHVDFLP
jgi:hypothetical protein